MDKSVLSNDDIKILRLEAEIRKCDKILERGDITYEQRDKTHKKSMRLLREQSALLYDRSGKYRKDRRHLLVRNSGYLDVSLLSANKIG